jgi:hypothetical protein
MKNYHQFLIVINMIGLGLGCNASKKAYHYYRLTDLAPYVAAITSVNETGEGGEVSYRDTVIAGSGSELWLAATVEYYYKEKRKDYTPAQRGLKGSEEKISAFNLYLDADDSRTPINDRIKKATLNSVKIGELPMDVPVPIHNRLKRSFDGPEDFAGQFNKGADPFLYDYNIAKAYIFTLDTKGIPPGQYSLLIELTFDSGRELRHESGLTIK